MLFEMWTEKDVDSVMHSDGNSFCGDIVLKSVNIASNYEDSTLDQIYKKQIFPDFMEILNSKSEENSNLK